MVAYSAGYLEEDFGFAELEVGIAHDCLADPARSRLALLDMRRSDTAQQNPVISSELTTLHIHLLT